MSEEIIDSGAGSPSGERPTFLTVLCILSFIAAGIVAVILILAAVAAGVAVSNGATLSGGSGGGWTYVAISLALTAVSLYGVIKMWKLQKVGFQIYAGAAVGAVVLDVAMVGFNIIGVIFAAAFVVMYYLNVKHMH